MPLVAISAKSPAPIKRRFCRQTNPDGDAIAPIRRECAASCLCFDDAALAMASRASWPAETVHNSDRIKIGTF
jgi:hypothetical protein